MKSFFDSYQNVELTAVIAIIILLSLGVLTAISIIAKRDLNGIGLKLDVIKWGESMLQRYNLGSISIESRGVSCYDDDRNIILREEGMLEENSMLNLIKLAKIIISQKDDEEKRFFENWSLYGWLVATIIVAFIVLVVGFALNSLLAVIILVVWLIFFAIVEIQNKYNDTFKTIRILQKNFPKSFTRRQSLIKAAFLTEIAARAGIVILVLISMFLCVQFMYVLFSKVLY